MTGRINNMLFGALMLVSTGDAQAMRNAVHVAPDRATMSHWLAQIGETRQFPPDLQQTLDSYGKFFVIEMSTAPGCVPCGDLWAKLSAMGQSQARGRSQTPSRPHAPIRPQLWRIGTISQSEAMLRSGRLGLPWVGHPVAWVRSRQEPLKMIPIAIGADHASNLRRNVYLAVKMLSGVRPAVGVRAMARFTGIVGKAPPETRPKNGPYPRPGSSDRYPGPKSGLNMQSTPERAPGKADLAARPLSSNRSPPHVRVRLQEPYHPLPLGVHKLLPVSLHGQPGPGARLG